MRVFTLIVSIFSQDILSPIPDETQDFYSLLNIENCPDKDKAELCEDGCVLDLISCLEDCGGSESCSLDCTRAEARCIEACPCHIDCPAGCAGCLSPFCTCAEFEQNLDYQECKKAADNEAGICADQCDIEDTDCIVKCYTDRVDQIKECPCQENCPNGCPCDNYECQHGPIDITDKAVLVLNTHTPYPGAILLNFDGKEIDGLSFEFGDDTYVDRSCAVTYKNEHFVFGGEDFTQVSKIDGCQLTRQAEELPFNFNFGTCGTFTIEEEDIILLCFSNYFLTGCYSFDGKNYSEIPARTSSSHLNSRLSNYKGIPFAMGGDSTVETEELMFGLWSSLDPYPFAQNYLKEYASVSLEQSVIIFGGFSDSLTSSQSNVVAEFAAGRWDQIGSLMQSRFGHGALNYAGVNLVVGGNDWRYTEVWNSEVGNYTATSGDQHYNFYAYPELFLVDSDFCL